MNNGKRWFHLDNYYMNKVCRICYEGEDLQNKLIYPCKCSGTCKYVHTNCLIKWMEINNNNEEIQKKCMECNHPYHFIDTCDTQNLSMFLAKCNGSFIFLKSVIIYIIFCFLDTKFCYKSRIKQEFTIPFRFNCSDIIGIFILSIYYLCILYLIRVYDIVIKTSENLIYFLIKSILIFCILVFLIVALYPIGILIVIILVSVKIRIIFCQEIKKNHNPNKVFVNYN